MWEYSIQEPLICAISGFVGILFYLTKDHWSKMTNFILFEIILTAFCLLAILINYFYTDDLGEGSIKKLSPKSLRLTTMAFFNYAYIIYIVIPIFFVIMNLTYILI
jgi:hypothetical protein